MLSTVAGMQFINFSFFWAISRQTFLTLFNYFLYLRSALLVFGNRQKLQNVFERKDGVENAQLMYPYGYEVGTTKHLRGKSYPLQHNFWIVRASFDGAGTVKQLSWNECCADLEVRVGTDWKLDSLQRSQRNWPAWHCWPVKSFTRSFECTRKVIRTFFFIFGVSMKTFRSSPKYQIWPFVNSHGLDNFSLIAHPWWW